MAKFRMIEKYLNRSFFLSKESLRILILLNIFCVCLELRGKNQKYKIQFSLKPQVFKPLWEIIFKVVFSRKLSNKLITIDEYSNTKKKLFGNKKVTFCVVFINFDKIYWLN